MRKVIIALSLACLLLAALMCLPVRASDYPGYTPYYNETHAVALAKLLWDEARGVKTESEDYMLKNRTGERYGRLLVLERAGDHVYASGRREVRWLCKCDCGTETVALACNLSSGNTTSCGCYIREIRGDANRTHGKSKTRLYKIWDGMKERCCNPKSKAYKNYGGRGVTICDEWRSDFLAFEKWAFETGYNPYAPTGECTIDRIDNSKSYSPNNCRWVGFDVQANNKRNNRQIKHDGRILTLAEWCRETGLSKGTVESRIDKHGWSAERALSTPVRGA